MKPVKDYTRYSFRIAALVLTIMLGVSFIPPFSIGGIHFKRANIVSDLKTFDDEERSADSGLTQLDLEFLAEAEKIEIDVTPDNTLQETIDADIRETVWEIGTGSEAVIREGTADAESELTELPHESDITKFEDYTEGEGPSVSDFAKLLGTATQNRVVRIAFLGDSYIEGDIITADVREQLQERYSGSGVGFVPFGTPHAQNRGTVSHKFSGWTNYNLINKRTTPEKFREKYTVTGWLNIPSEGASSTYKGVNFRKNLSSWSRARLIFINEGSTEIEVTVNDTLTNTFRPRSDERVQQLNIAGTRMNSVKISLRKTSGFVGYGVELEGTHGISVDNFSIRSNSGIALFGTDSKTNGQLRDIFGYDMIVMQYGLNAMDPNNTNYKSYGEQLRKVINYVKSCFPRSVIVLMGVGDRSTQRDGTFVTMAAVRAMIKEQRQAAIDCGITFWDTFQAMGGEGSMARFVEWNWAAKDYTHLGYRGGKHIATKFVDALEFVKRTAPPDADPNVFGPPASAPVFDINLTIESEEQEPIHDSIPASDEEVLQELILDMESLDGESNEDAIPRDSIIISEPDSESPANESTEPESVPQEVNGHDFPVAGDDAGGLGDFLTD